SPGKRECGRRVSPEAALDAPGPGDQTAQSCSRSPGKRKRDRGISPEVALDAPVRATRPRRAVAR
ncbi:hypothetical protein QTL54_12735, partial [Klebsiella michiganensis]